MYKPAFILFLSLSGLAQVMNAAFISSVSCTVGNQTVSSRVYNAGGCNLGSSSAPGLAGTVSPISTWGTGSESIVNKGGATSAYLTTTAQIGINAISGVSQLGAIATAAEGLWFTTAGPLREGLLTLDMTSWLPSNDPAAYDQVTITDGVHTYTENGCSSSGSAGCTIQVTDKPFLLGTRFWVLSYSHAALNESPATVNFSGSASDQVYVSLADSQGQVNIDDPSIPTPEPAMLPLGAVLTAAFFGLKGLRARRVAQL